MEKKKHSNKIPGVCLFVCLFVCLSDPSPVVWKKWQQDVKGPTRKAEKRCARLPIVEGDGDDSTGTKGNFTGSPSPSVFNKGNLGGGFKSAPTWCVRQDRWFQILFISTPIWGRCPIWLIFFRWVETTNQEILWKWCQFRWSIVFTQNFEKFS